MGREALISELVSSMLRLRVDCFVKGCSLDAYVALLQGHFLLIFICSGTFNFLIQL